MSYDLDLYFRSPDFPHKEWSEILLWFDAIEQTVTPEDLEHQPNLRKEWFIPVGGYAVFCSLRERHPRYHFKDDQAHWMIFIDTGSGFGLRQFIGYTLCYCAMSFIPEMSVWDCGQYFDSLYYKPDKFLRKVNAVISNYYLSLKYKRRLEMQQMGVMDENDHLIPDPEVLKRAAQIGLDWFI